LTASHSMTSAQLASAYQQACLAEIEAIKPGNVHLFADGHGMQVQDFIQSAEVSAAVIAKPDSTLGERIFQSVDATWQAVGCNTNLGIVLLCAPIIQASLQLKSCSPETALFASLNQVLSATTQLDAEWAFKAINLAQPAGLGDADTHDVKAPAVCNLQAAMKAAADRDMIALQYSNGFHHLITEGLPQFAQALSQWGNEAWAVTALYLYWLSHYPDSHIVRKYGGTVAQQVQQQAAVHHQDFLAQTNPKHYFSILLHFDADLKEKNINPGTSADMTVATLLLDRCIKK